MTLETSGVQSGDSSARLAATETPVLASQHINGAYNETMNEAIPSRGQRRWSAVVAEWRFIAAILAPFGVAVALYFIPATKGELENVKADAAAHLELAKANSTGQFQAVTTRIDALQSAQSDIKSDVKEMRSDLKELLKRSEPHQHEVQQFAVTAPPSPPQDNPPQNTRRVKKKTVQPIAAKPASGFRLW